MNPTNTASIISIDYNKANFHTTNEREFFAFIRDKLDTLENPAFTVGLTGPKFVCCAFVVICCLLYIHTCVCMLYCGVVCCV